MKGAALPITATSFVVPGTDGWTVTCSCGYLVTGLKQQALAQADIDNHVARCHAPDDDDA